MEIAPYAPAEKTVWAHTYERSMDEVFEIERWNDAETKGAVIGKIEDGDFCLTRLRETPNGGLFAFPDRYFATLEGATLAADKWLGFA